MESIDDKALTDESIYPDEKILKGVLGDSYGTYCELLDLFERNQLQCEWRYYQDGKAWLCKVQKKKKTILWMSAWTGHMKAAIYVPERLIDEVCSLKLTKETIERIQGTENIGKTRPCNFEIRSNTILEDLEQVMQFKISAK